MAALFAAQPGREGTFYGFSWDEILATNAAAVAAGRPQDCVAYEDSVGTVPLLAPLGVGKGCGLLLDREYGLVRGPELVTNGGFDSAAGWSTQTGWSISGGVAVATNTTAGALLFQSGALIPDAWYEVSIKVVVTASSVSIRLYGVNQFNMAASGTYLVKVQAGPAGTIAVSPATGFTGSVDDFSVRHLPGNHAVQPTAAARGEMSRRVNVLTATENFADAFWVKTEMLVSTAQGPDGTLTAAKITPTAVSSVHKIVGAMSLPSTDPYRYSICLKPAGARYVRVARGPFSSPVAVFDLIGLLAAGLGLGGQPPSISPLGDGWLLCSFSGTPGGVSGGFTIGVQQSFSTTEETFVGDGEAGVLIWHPDLRLNADALPSLPPYQRVTSAADYDEVGFPAYLRRQTDDWMRASVNPNGATKVAAFWAGQRFSSGATLIVFETSISSTSVQSTIGLLTSGTQAYSWRSRGASGSQGSATGGGVPQPAKLLFRGYASIEDDVCLLYINGQEVAASSADQGTGSYGAHPLFIGGRAGASLFDSHREYSPPLLIFMQTADPGLSASQIARIEREMNKSIKAY
jgi:hypothetical protein